MGIYIPGMEMPESCLDCFACHVLEDEGLYCEPLDTDLEPGSWGRLANCSIIPVPAHGRLGDLVALKERATKRLYASNHGSMAEAYYAAIIDLIDSAPTIIPADHIGDSNKMAEEVNE